MYGFADEHHTRMKCVCILVASAADDGSLHIVQVHVSQSSSLPKYSKLQTIREHRLEQAGEYITAMVHILRVCARHYLLYMC